jgi:hypothetical protein
MSLPTTDDLIDFEDLIVLSLNYQYAQRNVLLPCAGTMEANAVLNRQDDILEAQVMLSDNPGCLIGASVTLSYGPDLEYLGAAEGKIWSGVQSFFIDSPGQNSITLDAVSLSGMTDRNGCHAVARFRITDPTVESLSIQVEGFKARGPENVDLAGGYRVAEVGAGQQVPAAHALFSAIPNPTKMGASIRYALANETQVQIRLYDTTGRLVRSLVEGLQAAGDHEITWDGLTEGGAAAGQGIYYYRMEADEYTSTRKLIVVN